MNTLSMFFRQYELGRFLAGAAGLAFLLAASAGCMNVEYVGQKLPPEEVGTVAVFDSSDLVPADVYGVLGRAVLTAPEDYTMVDMREKLEEKAAEYGADAVEIVKVSKRKVGVSYTESDGVSAPPQPVQSQNLTADGGLIYTDTFGKNTTLRTETVDRYEVVINALFLAKKERLKKLTGGAVTSVEVKTDAVKPSSSFDSRP